MDSACLWVSFDALRSTAAAVSVFVSSVRRGTAGRADRQVVAALTTACQRALVAPPAAAAAAAAGLIDSRVRQLAEDVPCCLSVAIGFRFGIFCCR